MQSPVVAELAERYDSLKRRRSTWDDQFDTIQRLVRTNVPTFRGRELTRGDRRHDEIYDATAPWALETFASGLSSYATSPSERWFSIGFEGIPNEELTFPVIRWLEQVSDIIYHVYALPESNHAPSLHEVYLDLGGFGTAVLYQRADTEVPVKFRSFPLSDCFIDENSDGRIDVCFRRLMVTRRQLVQAFPKALADDKVMKAKADEVFEVVHSNFPRKDRDPKSLGVRGSRYVSVYWCPALDNPLEESGANRFLYHIPRWSKMAGDIYGRSPTMSVLPDIQMVNQMSKEVIYSAQLANRPPLVFDDDAMLFPVTSVVPGSLLFKEPGSEMPQPLLSGVQPQFAYELLSERRDQIRRALFVDYLLRPKKKERQTTVEVMDDRGEMLRQMAPMLGRLEVEMNTPMVEDTYAILKAKGMLPPPPPEAEEFNGAQMKVSYISQAAKAQFGTKVAAISQYLQDVAQLAQFDPTVIQIFDLPILLGELAKLRDLTPKVIKDPRELKRLQAQQEQQQQMAAAASAAPDISGAIKNVAQARQADPTLVQALTG